MAARNRYRHHGHSSNMALSLGCLVTSIISPHAGRGTDFCLSAIWGSPPCKGTCFTHHQEPWAQRHTVSLGCLWFSIRLDWSCSTPTWAHFPPEITWQVAEGLWENTTENFRNSKRNSWTNGMIPKYFFTRKSINLVPRTFCTLEIVYIIHNFCFNSAVKLLLFTFKWWLFLSTASRIKQMSNLIWRQFCLILQTGHFGGSIPERKNKFKDLGFAWDVNC